MKSMNDRSQERELENGSGGGGGEKAQTWILPND